MTTATETVDQAAATMRLLLSWSRAAFGQLRDQAGLLQLGRIRGTGPGVSFGAMVSALEEAHPLAVRFPFEGSDHVGGAVWHPADVLGDPAENSSIAKLRWRAGADDLPMHVHEHADRFIVILKGRGFFHWTHQAVGEFDGTSVRTIAARERDVFAFRRGLVHTFSTAGNCMTLLSVQTPFLEFDDPKQYRLPAHGWTCGSEMERASAVACVMHPPSGITKISPLMT